MEDHGGGTYGDGFPYHTFSFVHALFYAYIRRRQHAPR
jgi:hypothetical protein